MLIITLHANLLITRFNESKKRKKKINKTEYVFGL